MDAGMWFIQEESRMHESRCQSAMQVVRRARTMWEVKRAADVRAPSVLRSMHLHNQGAGRQLKNAAEQKMSELLDEHLKFAQGISDLAARGAYLSKLYYEEWNAMRGDYSQLHQRADREAQQLLAKL